MATEVYTTEEVRLQDETEVELRPLPIAKMRKFTRMWTDHIKEVNQNIVRATEEEDYEFSEQDFTDKQFDVFMALSQLCLAGQLQGEKTDKQFKSYLEDVLDEPTIRRILKVCGGLELNDPNQQDPVSPATVAAGTN